MGCTDLAPGIFVKAKVIYFISFSLFLKSADFDRAAAPLTKLIKISVSWQHKIGLPKSKNTTFTF